MQLVYQDEDGAALLQQDVAALGLQLVSQEQMLHELAQKAGPATLQAWQELKKEPTATSIQQATQRKQTLTNIVSGTKQLTARERKVLCEEGRSFVDTGFGTFHEQEALDLLQKQTGTEVYHRNAQIWEWQFITSRSGNNDSNETVVPRGLARPCRYKRRRRVRLKHTENKKEHLKAESSDTTWNDTLPESEDHHQVELSLDGREESRMSDTTQSLGDFAQSSVDLSKSSTRRVVVAAAEATTVAHNDDGEPSRNGLSKIPCKEEFSEKDIESANERLLGDTRPTTLDNPLLPGKMGVDNNIPNQEVEINQLSLQERNDAETIDLVEDSENDDFGEVDGTMYEEKSSAEDVEPPFFSILGSVDGLREEIVSVGNGNDDDSWRIERLVVEVKHRMRRIHKVPPLYEQVQAVVYALMYNTNATEIVQVLRSTPGQHKGYKNKKTKVEESSPRDTARQLSLDTWIKSKPLEATESEVEEKTSSPSFEMSVNRVSVDDPVLKHGQSWLEIVLPRLRSFVEAVYNIRSDDCKRYRLLLANSQDPGGSTLEGWELLHEECSWLQFCDTAYRRLAKEV
jgi:hypothetical protein